MDENQLKFITSHIENSILIGNPGCGKTTTIIEYCIHKYKNKLIESYENFYIISFSKDAQIDFIKRGNKSSNPHLFNKFNIKTIHALSYKILAYFNKLLLEKTSINVLILTTFKLLENKTKNELLEIVFLSNIKFIIIDEAQDINENQYNLISLLCNKLNIPLILVGDPNQNIYQFQGGNDKYLLNHSNKIYTLNNNYRSSNEIIKFLNYIRPHSHFPEMKAPKKQIEKNKPFLYVNDIHNILQHIKKQLLITKYNLEDIAIIGPVKLSKINKYSKDATDENKSIGLQLICNFLHENNIKFIKHFSDVNENDANKLNDAKKIKDHVNILTSHSSKGLEFKKVLVINYQLKTFSTAISNYDYEKFKYLWYVTLSRAIHKLIIYVRKDEDIFYNIFNVPNNLYSTNNINKLTNKYDLNSKFYIMDKPNSYEITKIINDNSYLSEERFYIFLNNFKYTIKKEKIYNIDSGDIFEHYKYNVLYGLIIERLFQAYYYKKINKFSEFIKNLLNKHNNVHIINKTDDYNIKIYGSLIKKGIIINKILYYSNDCDNTSIKLTPNEKTFIEYYKNKTSNINDIIEIHLENILYKYDIEYFTKLCKSLNNYHNRDNFEYIIFYITLYFYQLENECKYLLDYDFTNHFKSLSIYFNHIKNYTKQFNNKLVFDVKCEMPSLKMIGYIDFIQNNKINEIKFTKQFNEKHILQTILYYNCLYPKWDFKKEVIINNLFNGYKYTINFNDVINTNFWLNSFLSDMLQIKLENQVFIINCPVNNENNKCILDYNFNLCYHCKDNNEFENNLYKILIKCKLPIFIAYNGNSNEFLYIHKIYNKLKNIDDNDKVIKILNIKNYYSDNKNFNKNAKNNVMQMCKMLKKINYNNYNLQDINLDNPYY